MKNNLLIIALLLSAVAFLSSCNKDEDPAKPVITLNELGLGNSQVGYIGADLHIEADIVAEGKIQTVKVEIHPEGSATWEFEKTYTEFAGLKNTTFHKHIDIASAAEAGDYHFHLVVTDEEGNETVAEAELEIQAPTDNNAPVITVSTAPSNGQSYINGETITIAGSVTDDIALGGIYIGLVRVDQNLPDAQVNADNTITLLHFHDFVDPTSYDFTGSIVVGATEDNDITPDPINWTSGDYYLVIKSPDAFGGNVGFSTHYPVVINI